MSYGEYLLGVVGGLFGWFATPEAAITGIWVAGVIVLAGLIYLVICVSSAGLKWWWAVWLLIPIYLFFLITFVPWAAATIDPVNYGR